MESKEAQDAYWQAHVLAWQASGQTQRADGVEHGLNPHGLQNWPLCLQAKDQNAVRPPRSEGVQHLHSPLLWFRPHFQRQQLVKAAIGPGGEFLQGVGEPGQGFDAIGTRRLQQRLNRRRTPPSGL